MGLKKGESLVRLGIIRVVSVKREKLRAMTDNTDYGYSETIKEGFPKGVPEHSPALFVEMFCRHHRGCTPETIVTRIEFEYVDLPPNELAPYQIAVPPAAFNIVKNAGAQ